MDAFEMLWKGKSVSWEFQKQIGPFFADFAIPKAHIVVEIDGGYHLQPTQVAYDARRTAYLEDRGWTVMRFSNDQTINNPLSVVKEISRGFGLSL